VPHGRDCWFETVTERRQRILNIKSRLSYVGAKSDNKRHNRGVRRSEGTSAQGAFLLGSEGPGVDEDLAQARRSTVNPIRRAGLRVIDYGLWPPNESRLSCGALKKDSFHNLRAPPVSSAC